MRLKQIKDYIEANRFLKEEFLPWYNQRYTIPVKDSYRPLPKDCNLETIFCIKHPRKVGRDNTTSYPISRASMEKTLEVKLRDISNGE